jgi:phage baseplate assembly protein W
MPITYTMPAAPAPSPPTLPRDGALVARDVRFTTDYTIASGDYALVEGDAAVKQSIVCEARTSPGELASVPDYGYGLAASVRKAATKSVRDERANRVRERARRNPRVDKVLDVITTATDAGELKLEVRVTAAGRQLSTSIIQEPL